MRAFCRALVISWALFPTLAFAEIGIWTTAAELQALPMSGPAWNSLLSEANSSCGSPDLSNQDDDTNVCTLAKALVYARTGNSSYRNEVISILQQIPETENGGRTLALGRELAAYVVAADLVGYDTPSFRSWLSAVRWESLSGKTLISTHEDRPNNWGTHACASRVAAAMFLGDSSELQAAAEVMHGWLGDRSVYSGFSYGSLTWQCDESKPVGINPPCTKNGCFIGGVVPDDQRRGSGAPGDCPNTNCENYVHEALQGAMACAHMLHRAGYPVFEWEDRAFLRAYEWLHTDHFATSSGMCPATSDDEWTVHIANHYYGTAFPADVPAGTGKNFGWTDYTMQGDPVDPPPPGDPPGDPNTPDPNSPGPGEDPDPCGGVDCGDGIACTLDWCSEGVCFHDAGACPAGSTPALREVREGSSSGSTSVSTDTVVQGVAGDLYLAAVSYKPNTTVSDVSGLGLTWHLADEQCGGRHQTGISVWWAQGTPSGPGAVTAHLGSAPSNAVIAVSRYSGVSQTQPIGNGVSGNTNGLDGGCSGGSDASSYAMNLPVATSDALVFSAAALRNRSHSPGAGYTETFETSSGSGGNGAAAAAQERPVALPSNALVDGSFSRKVDWAVVGLEIRSGDTAVGCVSDAECDDGLFCNGGETCDAGSCLAGSPVDCDDGVSCTADACDDGAGCLHVPQHDVCDNGLACDGTESCHGVLGCQSSGDPSDCGDPSDVSLQETSEGGSENSASVSTSGSLAAVAGDLYLAAVSYKPARSVSAVSGLGLTWTRVDEQCSGRRQTGVSVWQAQGNPSGSGSVTATLDSAPFSAVIAVSRYTGVNPTAPIGGVASGNTNGAEGGCSGGTDNTAYTIDLPVAASGSIAYGAVALRHRRHAPGVGYTETAEISAGSGGNAAGAALQERLVPSAATTPVNGSFSSSLDWAVIGVEIRAGSVAASSASETPITLAAALGAVIEPPADECGATATCDAPAAAAETGSSGAPEPAASAASPDTGAGPGLQIETDKSLKVAFLGDTGFGSDAQAVWELVRDERADMILQQGGLAHGSGGDADADAWQQAWQGILGANFPYFYSIGDVDADAWQSTYRPSLEDRIDLLGADCTPFDGAGNAACTYRGLFFVLSGGGRLGSPAGDEAFIRNALQGTDAVWSVCSWHHNQRELQVGGSGDEVGWGAYEACREAGALIATAHDHSYARTRTLISMESPAVDPDAAEAHVLRLAPGATFAFVNGLGGAGIGGQERCLPTSFPYGCAGEWAKIYTADQGARPGVLFMTFHLRSDPGLARGVFMNVDGQVVDTFEVRSALAD